MVAIAFVGALALASCGVVNLEFVGTNSVHADVGQWTEDLWGFADAITAAVVVEWALRGNWGALSVGWANGVVWQQCQAVTTVVRGLAAAWGGDTSVDLCAECGSSWACQDARQVISGWEVIGNASQTKVSGAQCSGSLVDDAVVDEWKASLEIISGVVTGFAKEAGSVEWHKCLAVGDDVPALSGVRGQLVVGDASLTIDLGGNISLGNIGGTVLNVWNASSVV